MYQTIMVPLDGSRYAEAAVPLARAIAERAGAELHLVMAHHSVVPGGIPEGFSVYAEKSREVEQEYLKGAPHRLVPGEIVRTSTTFLDGPVAEALTNFATDRQPDLVVMTTHGRGAFSRFWVGSVADQLIRSLPMPMLLVRPDPDDTSAGPAPVPERIAVAVDRSGFGEAVIEPAAELGSLFGAELMLLHIVHHPMPIAEPPVPYLVGFDEGLSKELESQAETYLGALAGALREDGLPVVTKIAAGGDTASSILGLVEEAEAGMIALATHGESGVRRLLLGSVADKVMRGASVPVLMCRPKSED